MLKGKIVGMENFGTQREAKEYLIGKIVKEAAREGKPLSEIERKMLYFSETGWTLPDIVEVNKEFERECDNDDYERKICALGQSIETQLEIADANESDAWYEAIQKLSDGDHYLLVLLNPKLAGRATPKRPPRDLLKLWLTGAVIAVALVASFILYEQLFGAR